MRVTSRHKRQQHDAGGFMAHFRSLNFRRRAILISSAVWPALMVTFFFHVVINRESTVQHSFGAQSLCASDRAELSSLSTNDLMNCTAELSGMHQYYKMKLSHLEKRHKLLSLDVWKVNELLHKLKTEHHETIHNLHALSRASYEMAAIYADLNKTRLPKVSEPENTHPFKGGSDTLQKKMSSATCRLYNCFDYSRCSVTSRFPVYVYNPRDYPGLNVNMNNSILQPVISSMYASPYITSDPHKACIFIVLVDIGLELPREPNPSRQDLQNLPHWHGDGRNHVILNLNQNFDASDRLENNIGRAMIVQTTFMESSYRKKYDQIIPPLSGATGNHLEEIPLLLPIERRHFLSFWGTFKRSGADTRTDNAEKIAFEELDRSRALHPGIKLNIQLNCSTDESVLPSLYGEWGLCGPETIRHKFLRDSIFTLVPTPSLSIAFSTSSFQSRLRESLKFGAIPVILGRDVELPYAEILKWDKSAIFFPRARISELLTFLRTFTHSDIVARRQQGRSIWQTFLANTKNVVDTILNLMRTRLNIPAMPFQGVPSPRLVKMSHLAQTEDDCRNNLLPSDPQSLVSPRFRNNYTKLFDQFSIPWEPFRLFPSTPYEQVLPTLSMFTDSTQGFRPLEKGVELEKTLGGNHPAEQFTVVILTYDRYKTLIDGITNLKGLQHLNKVVVVWNSRQEPFDDIHWPDIGVDIHVVAAEKNSLNNRFLPYEAIETDAILSLDDDVYLTREEIRFGFRVWREARDRLVGYPGRVHTWNMTTRSWMYNLDPQCEISMVLTGAAFFHKYYSYVYSYVMPRTVRRIVDEHMNCEDIAMNFLVSHLTKKPPIKVTGRQDFVCPGCLPGISANLRRHLEIRHVCLNSFVKIFGYMPLVYTQFRASSVLMNVDMPANIKRCYRHV